MAKIVAILNSKGGSGKSTIATNLARGLQMEGRDALIVDTDPQGTTQDWSELHGGDSRQPAVVGVTKAALKQHLDKLGTAFDIIVIDGAAKLQETIVAAMKVSDLVLMPVRPSAADLWAVEDLVELIKTRQEVTGGKPKAAFIVSQKITGTNLAAEISGVLEGYAVPTLNSRTAQRVAYAEALSSGTTVLDMKPKGKAASEIREITKEVIALIDG